LLGVGVVGAYLASLSGDRVSGRLSPQGPQHLGPEADASEQPFHATLGSSPQCLAAYAAGLNAQPTVIHRRNRLVPPSASV
jgi:hypothetical protein